MTTYTFTGSDTIDYAQFNPPRADDEYIGNFFGERDEVQIVQGIMQIDMGTGNDNVRGYCSGGVIYLGDGDDNAATGIDAPLKVLYVYGQAGDDILSSAGFGERGDIRLYGGDDSDKFEPDVKSELIDGGRGFDFISPISSLSSGTAVNFVTSDTLISIEGQDGSAADDLITSWGTDATAVYDIFRQIGISSVTNALQGFRGSDTLQGAGQSDILVGNGYRFLQEKLGNFRGMSGGVIDREALTEDDAARDDLRGSGGNDYLDGGDGADRLDGGEGIDTVSYASFQASNSSGVTVNLATGANSDGDVLISIENIIGSDYTGYYGTGDDTLLGNGNTNIIVGRSGSNTLNGQGGRDSLYGGSGFDILIDPDGGDTLYGGADNDIYRLGQAATIVELVGGGYDFVESAVTCTLSANVERLTLTGSASINGTGNVLGNFITGNRGANVLDGKAGADSMYGGSGDDRYYVDNRADGVGEARGKGIDTVYASVSYGLGAGQYIEQLLASNEASTTPLRLTGNEFGNRIKGNAGDNTLNGALGADTLYGMKGKDTFVFNRNLSSANVDHLGDFSAADDTIKLDKGNFMAISTGTLKEGAFKDLSVAGAAVDANDRILYDKATGALFYDADGSGSKAAVQFAIVDTKATLTHADFLIVS